MGAQDINMSLKFQRTWAWTNKDVELILGLLDGAPKPIIHICSGASAIGDIRMDIAKIDSEMHLSHGQAGHLNIKGDMYNIPIKDGMAGCVICDPPYDCKMFIKNVYDGVIAEIVRITKPGGKIIIYSPWVFTFPMMELIEIIPNKVGKERCYMKLATVNRKSNGQIGDYV